MAQYRSIATHVISSLLQFPHPALADCATTHHLSIVLLDSRPKEREFRKPALRLSVMQGNEESSSSPDVVPRPSISAIDPPARSLNNVDRIKRANKDDWRLLQDSSLPTPAVAPLRQRIYDRRPTRTGSCDGQHAFARGARLATEPANVSRNSRMRSEARGPSSDSLFPGEYATFASSTSNGSASLGTSAADRSTFQLTRLHNAHHPSKFPPASLVRTRTRTNSVMSRFRNIILAITSIQARWRDLVNPWLSRARSSPI